MKPSIYLLGFRGAGKSALLKGLRELLGCEALDFDSLLEEKFGETILRYVERCGIEAFRREECELLRHWDAHFAKKGKGPALLATGGGIVDWRESRELLAASPHARVYLRTPPNLLWERLQEAPERRKIGDLHSLERLRELLAERSPNYENLATHILENEEMRATLEKLARLCDQLWR